MEITPNNISLELSRRLTDIVNAACESGEMLQKVTLTTASLLKYWFSYSFCSTKPLISHARVR